MGKERSGVFRTLFSFRALLFAFGLVAVGLPIALVAQLGIARTLTGIDADIAAIREGQFAAADVLELQLEEETGLRGYAASGQRSFLDPYRHGLVELPSRLADLRAALARLPDDEAAKAAAAELGRLNDDWLVTVAIPVIEERSDSLQRQVRGKRLIDRFRADVVPIQAAFERRFHAAIAERNATVRRNVLATIAATAAIAVELLVFGIVIARMRRELDRERSFVVTLQSATAGRLVPPRHLAIGSAYRSATRGVLVGGDVYDVYRIDGDRTLLVIGDISGKGLTAAVDTTFVRFALRTLASEHASLAEVATRFDALYAAADPAPEAFVTLFAGVHDRRDGSLVYANMGHEACWIRRGGELEQLAPTGPVIGLGGMQFAQARTSLRPGETLVLATDGLTEARDPDGGFVPADHVRAWIAQADSSTPQHLVDGVIAAVSRYVHGRISDDLAVLAVTPL